MVEAGAQGKRLYSEEGTQPGLTFLEDPVDGKAQQRVLQEKRVASEAEPSSGAAASAVASAHRLGADIHHEGVDVVLGLGELVEEGHHIEARVLEQLEAHGWGARRALSPPSTWAWGCPAQGGGARQGLTGVLQLLHVPAVLEVLVQAVPAGTSGREGQDDEMQCSCPVPHRGGAQGDIPRGVLGPEGDAERAAGAIVVGIEQPLPVTRVVDGVVPTGGGQGWAGGEHTQHRPPPASGPGPRLLLQEPQHQRLQVIGAEVAALERERSSSPSLRDSGAPPGLTGAVGAPTTAPPCMGAASWVPPRRRRWVAGARGRPRGEAEKGVRGPAPSCLPQED